MSWTMLKHRTGGLYNVKSCWLSFIFVLRTTRYRIGKHHQEILTGFEFGKIRVATVQRLN